MLERFSGYTLQTLMAEDSALLRMVKIEALGKRPDERAEGGEQHGWQ